MKFKLITILFVLISLQLYGQNKIATINGFVNNKLFKHAYLYDAESKETKVCKIVANKFKFELEQTKELKMYNLFLGTESSVLPESEIQDRIKNRSETRMLALENASIDIVDGIQNAVIYGGELNKAVDGMNKSIKNLDHDSYFEKFPDSPVSVVFLKALVPLTKHPMIADKIDVKSYYAQLSDRIKNSEDGKALYVAIFK